MARNRYPTDINKIPPKSTTYLDAPDLQAGGAASVGEGGMHDASTGLLGVLAGGLDLSGLYGECGSGV